jgi:hypothetical protein
MAVRPNLLAVFAVAAVCASGPAMALDPRHPDWPCQQLKVPKISVASVWTGAPIDQIDKSRLDDPAIEDLVTRLAARRTPMDEAQKLIEEFVSGTDDAKQTKATTLFAATFSVLNAQRDEVMNGIERFSRKEKDMAEEIRAKTQQMQHLQDAPDGDREQVDKLANGLAWETRIFEERRKSLSYVCEVPTLIEKRMFDLAHAIQGAASADRKAN